MQKFIQGLIQGLIATRKLSYEDHQIVEVGEEEDDQAGKGSGLGKEGREKEL